MRRRNIQNTTYRLIAVLDKFCSDIYALCCVLKYTDFSLHIHVQAHIFCYAFLSGNAMLFMVCILGYVYVYSIFQHHWVYG